MTAQQTLQPGQRIRHTEFGEGVIVGAATNGFVRVFFSGGERQVPVVSLTPIHGRAEQIVRSVASGERRTLKRRARVKRLMDAPMWDLVIFDEAQHLTAYRSGGKTKKTENYKLAEALKGHCRDLVLLSATPHQGDHYRFYSKRSIFPC